jgi:hypothetical protein
MRTPTWIFARFLQTKVRRGFRENQNGKGFPCHFDFLSSLNFFNDINARPIIEY